MTDPSELQRALASAADLGKKASASISQILADFANLKGQLDTIAPIISALHKKMTEGEPALLTPVELPKEEPQPIAEEGQH